MYSLAVCQTAHTCSFRWRLEETLARLRVHGLAQFLAVVYTIVIEAELPMRWIQLLGLILHQGSFCASAIWGMSPGRCIVLSLSLCTTSRLAPWTRGESNLGKLSASGPKAIGNTTTPQRRLDPRHQLSLEEGPAITFRDTSISTDPSVS